MPIGTSDGNYYEDEYAHATAMHENAISIRPVGQDKPARDAAEIKDNELAGSFQNRFNPAEYKPLAQSEYNPNPSDVEDRRGESMLGVAASQLTTQKLQDIYNNPLVSGLTRGMDINAARPLPEETELSKQAGSSDLGMPLGSPTEPAGALKSGGLTPTPARASILNAVRGMAAGSEEAVKNLPQNFVDSIKGALKIFSLPGDVKSGEVNPMSEEGIQKTADLAMTMVGVPAPVAAKLADGTLGSFAGVKSAGMKEKMADLGHAQVLESNAVHPDEILQKTGFFRGADNRWRYEIDDSKSSFDRKWFDSARHASIGEDIAALPKVLDHPELYKAYPKLQDIRVIRDPYYNGGAEWDASKKTIRMNPRVADNQGILMHEIQHAIQDQEGFARGGYPGNVGIDYTLKYAPFVRALVPEAKKLYEKAEAGEVLTPEEQLRAMYLKQVALKYNEYHEAADKAAYEYYMRLAGETEARNTDIRLLMTEEERRGFHPRHTQDVDTHSQIPIDEVTMATAYGAIDSKGKLIK